MNFYNKEKFIYIYLLVFIIVNLIFLTNFPFIHSDEAWLSGLSRQIMNSKSLSTTEPFFDLKPRHPHAIKVFFHFIQIIFIKTFSYNIFVMRLISLIAGTLSLYIFYKIAKLITDSKILQKLSVIILSIDIHYIYTSHLARQEIIITLIFLLATFYYLNNYNYHNNIKKNIKLAAILGLGMGIHPNIFIISLPFILIYTYNLIFSNKVKLKNYLAFGSTLAIIASFFILISLYLDPSFFSNYSAYGKSLGVFSSFITKLDRFDYFYQKIFNRISGTYFIPPIKPQLILFGATFIFSLVKLLVKKDNKQLFLLLSVVAINLGYIIIGRYNQTSIIFIFPVFYLLIINLLTDIKIKYSYILAIILITLLSFNTGQTVINNSHYNYKNYLKNISAVVKPDNKVLANLNTAYYFENGKLHDYRNLSYLKDKNLTFAEYIEKNNIKYIIYPEEMDYIYNTRPVWNILYGNIYPYYNEMKRYLENNTKLVHQFSNKTYAMRIVRYIGEENWKVKIYKVK